MRGVIQSGYKKIRRAAQKPQRESWNGKVPLIFPF